MKRRTAASGETMMSERILKINSAAVGYGGKILIGDISFEVTPGEIVTLIGPNGAGKSTILKSIAGQLGLLGGAVFLDGKDMAGMPRGEIARSMASLFTDRVKPELMTCFDVAAAGRYPYTGRMGLLGPEDRRIASETLALVGAAEIAEKSFLTVSDGQRQLVLLARALCQEPRVLILDEPTSYLDIRYKLSLLTTLRKMAREEGLAVLMSLHELDLARRVSDRIVCVAENRIDRIGTPKECFERGYIAQLFHMAGGRYDACFDSLEYGPGAQEAEPGDPRELSERQEAESVDPGKPALPAFDHYVTAGGRRLRCGYTTGTSAALAAAAAAQRLLLGKWPETVALMTPKGIRVEVLPEEKTEGPGWAQCAVRKDGGDDADRTNGVFIFSKVTLTDADGIVIRGGEGVGRVTKPGLDQPVGEAAINHVPREMIAAAVREIAEAAGYHGGLIVTVSVPGGEEIARQTFNPQLGIEGGISILGTSGIVEPMSEQALIETVRVELRQAYELGNRRVILVPGNYGMDFLARERLVREDIPVVKCSNFIGEAIDEAGILGFRDLLLVGHAGKLVKLAGGIMNTHSRTADCRTEIFTAHAALCGADRETCRRLMEAATTDACLEILMESGTYPEVMESITEAIRGQMLRRAQAGMRAGAYVFTNRHGPVGVTREAREMLKEWNFPGETGISGEV